MTQQCSLCRYSEFCKYLAERNRAGVVEQIKEGNLPGKRTMYLIPSSQQVAASLQIAQSTDEPCLLALLMPAPKA